MAPKLPMLPLRDLVVLPGSVVPIFIGRDRSVKAVNTAIDDDERLILIFTLIDPEIEEPKQGDLGEIGTIAEVLQVIKLADGTMKALFESRARVKLDALEGGDFFVAQFSDVKEIEPGDDGKKLFVEVAAKFARWARLIEIPLFHLQRFTPEMNLSWATDRIATNLRLSNADTANCLNERSVDKRIQLLNQLLDDLISKNSKELLELESHWRDQPELEDVQLSTEETSALEAVGDLFAEVNGAALKSSVSPVNLRNRASGLTYNQLTNGDNWLSITHGLANHAGFETAIITREQQKFPFVFLNYIAQDAILRKFQLLQHIDNNGCAVLSIELPGEGHRYFLLIKVEQDKTPILLAIAITEDEANMHSTSEMRAEVLSALGGAFSSLDRKSVFDRVGVEPAP